MSIAGKRALITGIQGFTGRYMAAELQAGGYEVIGMGTQPSDEPGYFQVDLADGICVCATYWQLFNPM
jgi:GDP-D-mannose dehydratase